MTNKILTLILFVLSTVNFAQAQKKYEVVKIDKDQLETMNVIYLKRKSLFCDRIYRIITHKDDTLITNKKEIAVGDILKLILVRTKNDSDIKDGFFEKPDKNTFFYHDSYEGKNVDIHHYCPNFVGLYYMNNVSN